MATDYTAILPTGEAEAIPAQSLADIMGFKSTRELRRDIARSRYEGQLICSSQEGYFLPATRGELTRFVKTMDAKAIGMFAAVKSARRALKDMDQQESEEATTE